MEKKEYYKELSSYLKQHDLSKANRVVMEELASLLVSKREDFIFMLNSANVIASNEMTDAELVDLFLDNIHNNKKLLLGAAFLISHNNKTASFNGEEEHNEDGLKATHKVLYNYFDADIYDNFVSDDEEHSNVWGTAIAGAVGGLAGLGGKLADNQRAKKFGATDTFAKKAEAKQQMVQTILAQRQSQQIEAQKKIEASSKTKRIILISVASLLGLALIGGVIYAIKKRN
jgi:hypothetical protein